MKKHIVPVVFLLACIGVQAQSADQTVLNLSKKKFGWMIRMQYDSLESILDDRLMFVHSNGWTESKQDLIKDMKSGKLRYVTIDISDAVVRTYTGMAIVTGKGKFNVLLDGSELIINLFYTEVYTQKDGKWLLATRHSNRLP